MEIIKVIITENNDQILDYIIKYVGADLRVGSIFYLHDYKIKEKTIIDNEIFVTFDFNIVMGSERIFIKDIKGKVI